MAKALGDLSFYRSERLYVKAAPKHVDQLISIYQKDPGAIFKEGQEEEDDMRGVLEVTASNLAFQRCDLRLARKIKRAL